MPTETGEGGSGGWLRWLGAAIVLLGLGGGAGYMLARRRPSEAPDHAIFVATEADPALHNPPAAPDRKNAPPATAAQQRVDTATQPSPSRPVEAAAPAPAPAVPSQSAAPSRSPPEFLARPAAPQLLATLRPRRAGTNLTGAAVDYVITLTNPSASPARDIRVDLGLLSASAQQDAQLRGFYAAPVERPVVAPFELPPGGQIELTGMATLPRETLHVMEAEGRPFFVPVVAMSARYQTDGNARQLTAAWIVGVDRGGEAKMAPFRLDTPPRMHDKLAARVHQVE